MILSTIISAIAWICEELISVLEGHFMPEHMVYDGALEHVWNHNN